MKSDYRMFISVGFGYALIFNLIGTNRYGMYPTWVLVAACFVIGIAMVAGAAFVLVSGTEEKKTVEVYHIPIGSPYWKPKPRVSMA